MHNTVHRRSRTDGRGTTAKETLGFRNPLQLLFPQFQYSMGLEGDNQACNLIGRGQAGLRKVRHLSLNDLFLKEVCGPGAETDRRMTLTYVPTGDNVGDLLTKVQSENLVGPLLAKLGFRGDGIEAVAPAA